MSRQTSGSRHTMLKTLREGAEWLQEARRSKAFQNRRSRRRIRRNLSRLVALRTIGPPSVLLALSLAWADILAHQPLQQQLNVAAGGARLLSYTLAGLQINHQLDGWLLEFPSARLRLYNMFSWSLGLGGVAYLTALHLTWKRAKWVRSLIILSLAPVLYWAVPLACICVLAAAASIRLLNEQASIAFLTVCALPTVLLLSSTDQLASWIRARCWLPFWGPAALSAPAVVGWAGIVSLGIIGCSTSDGQLAAVYQHATRLVASRRSDFGAGSDQQRFQAIDASLAAGDELTAVTKMRALARSSGYAMAHLWLANYEIGAGSYQANNTADDLLVHLEVGLQRDLQDPSVWPQAVSVYRKIKPFAAEYYMQRAWRFTAEGRPDAALQESQIAQGYYRELVVEQPYSLEFPLQLSKCCFFREEFAEALRVLEDAQTRNPAGVFDQAVDQLYVAWYDELTRRAPRRATQRLSLLKRGLGRDRNNDALLSRLASLAMESSGRIRNQCIHILKGVHGQAGLPAGVHFVLGGLAVAKKDLPTAIKHYEQVNSMQPNRSPVLNNLAWCLASVEPPDLARALALADRAIQLAPDNMEFRETRGQILAHLERWREAITELERALTEMPGYAPIHCTLARAYEQVGMTDLAATHRRFAARAAAEGPAR